MPTTMQSYQERPMPVLAWQWNGEPRKEWPDEVRKFSVGYGQLELTEVDGIEYLMYQNNPDIAEGFILWGIGFWFVFLGDGNGRMVTADVFEATYEAHALADDNS